MGEQMDMILRNPLIGPRETFNLSKCVMLLMMHGFVSAFPA
jgi:hypothetical protein